MEISEKNFKIEEINETIGGMSFVKPSEVPKTFEVKGIITSCEVVETEWGKRYEFILIGTDGNEYPISSWNFVSRKKYKPVELLNRPVVLKAYNTKKFLLEVI